MKLNYILLIIQVILLGLILISCICGLYNYKKTDEEIKKIEKKILEET